ncbi:MAG: class I SAM-dependent methyltransferase [Synergistales bacterium]|nr:class I SAM-dependent methyltransferase [Synergistales bacterium]
MEFGISENLIRKHSMGPNPIKLLTWNLQGVSIDENCTVLDLGSGKGITAAYLASVYNCLVFALDKWVSPDEAFAAIAECSPTRWPIPLRGDARELPFPSEYFDLIIATDSFIIFWDGRSLHPLYCSVS